MATMIRVGFGLIAAAVALGSETEFHVPSTDAFFYAETFQNGLAWTKTSSAEYAGQPVEVDKDPSLKASPFGEDRSLVLLQEAKKYGVAGAFKRTLVPKGKPLVVQYEVKLTKGLSCGGAYLKLLREGVDVDSFDGTSPYTIMFGPDSCGDTHKVHFILQHRSPVTGEWEEKHMTQRVAPNKDTSTHLYSLVVRPDNTYEVFVDLESQAKGSLLEDMTPPVNPPAEIDDPSDFKPDDWVDAKRIKDPEAVKPSEWDEEAPRRIPDPDAEKPKDWLDEEPDQVPDPKAEMPEDWDEDEDGDYEPPMVPNPKCAAVSGCGEWKRPEMDNPSFKGKWYPPMIDNPAYKGEWKAAQIPNPNFFEDSEPASMAPMSAVAVEVWTMSGGIRFDNVIISQDEAAAVAFAKETFVPKSKAEQADKKVKTDEEKKQDRERKRSEGGLNNLIEVYLGDAMDLVMKNTLAVLATALCLMAALIFACTRSPSPPPRAEPRVAVPITEDDEEDEDADEDDKCGSGKDEKD
mmetsp:Transcript_2830/g.6312  ORF Transcript_2830/g.6312 Transcript_2830/m.6312 type:complete len:517 (-) Transcript_2830:315-1865(-)|eukprot:CAMPEP_0172617600 /NCGR_PEP_ID=MMETSP1068-20121228/70343_1 /TAXON_ID=35684 /ORGANISM="Pseudopedinella elastica, Strain CCMP716" /LENGTH=516 /DNA_ID=CAMNT_0013423389 /DNA_START=110 /DNA_END=1660 /DNA_ORIENTATION=+